MERDDENILLHNNSADRVQGRKKWKITIEPALIVLFFGFNLAESIIPNQLLEQTCLNYGFNGTDCLNLVAGNTTKEIEESIQPLVADILMTSSLVNAIIPAIMSLFIGPWTDTHGRKKVIVATFFGFSGALMLFTFIAFYSTKVTMIDPRLFIFAYIPMVITGGWPTMIAVILCYINDISSPEMRSSRLTIIEMLIFGGVFFGTLSCSFILSLTSPTIVFLIATVCALLASFYVVFFVEESIQVDQSTSKCQQIRELISYLPVLEMLKTCFKKRSFHERRILWCLIVILMFSIFCLNGTGTVFYLFVRERFDWTLKDATLFSAANLVASMIGSALGLTLFKKYFNCSDLSLAVLALVSVFVDSLMRTFAQTGIQMYIASAVTIFKILSAPMCRSLIASIIPNTEIGKVFSITSSFEAVSSLAASPLYTFMYEKTFKYFASAFFLITTVAYLVNLILIYCVARMKKTRDSLVNPYATIDNS